eukprot:CAMPEP_0184115548 /NCGR_PEP_ID=MMETSP0974-20121125/19986_1 /TAXON_ID=483370 /ORGANISM="non described non described, Strain CCMP2097" /LENGTH=54 /DNA_ID=CAMNT_0026418673 /DNA_START=205 /DNA_END=369 /DNA_ORIENTATION=-
MICASGFPSSACFCSRRSTSSDESGATARQSGQRSSFCRHLTEQSAQIVKQQHE